MGNIYLLKKVDFKYDGEISDNFVIKNTLENDEADELLLIQAQISSEISEPIHLLTKNGLTTKSNIQADGLVYCLAKNENHKSIGYGYGYIDSKNIFYLDTIGVHPDYRGNGVGTKIKVTLINHAFEDSDIDTVKAITQSNNLVTVSINEKLGFKGKEQSSKSEK
jgi:ribosomal protein S18 acetylase RimI-like enzyme